MVRLVVHTAYSVVLPEITKVLATEREVPAHAEPAAGCVVHQPLNEYPLFASPPLLAATVTVATAVTLIRVVSFNND